MRRDPWGSQVVYSKTRFSLQRNRTMEAVPKRPAPTYSAKGVGSFLANVHKPSIGRFLGCALYDTIYGRNT